MQVFSDLYEFNEQLILSLRFNRESLQSVARNYKTVPQILQGEKVLDGEDGKIIDDYVFNLGLTDALSQIDYLSGRRAMLEKLKTESSAEYKRYSSLYVKIFFLIGVLLAVLLA